MRAPCGPEAVITRRPSRIGDRRIDAEQWLLAELVAGAAAAVRSAGVVRGNHALAGPPSVRDHRHVVERAAQRDRHGVPSHPPHPALPAGRPLTCMDQWTGSGRKKFRPRGGGRDAALFLVLQPQDGGRPPRTRARPRTGCRIRRPRSPPDPGGRAPSGCPATVFECPTTRTTSARVVLADSGRRGSASSAAEIDDRLEAEGGGQRGGGEARPLVLRHVDRLDAGALEVAGQRLPPAPCPWRRGAGPPTRRPSPHGGRRTRPSAAEAGGAAAPARSATRAAAKRGCGRARSSVLPPRVCLVRGRSRRAARPSAALVEDDLSVHDDVFDPGGVLVRLLERGLVDDTAGVEHGDVRPLARAAGGRGRRRGPWRCWRTSSCARRPPA